MRGRFWLITAGVLMLLLGVARGGGGVTLLVRGAAADPAIQAGVNTVKVLGTLLVAIGALLVVSAVGVLRGSSRLWRLGLFATLAFVIDGALNGALLYGAPGIPGTVANGFSAVLIIWCLFLGRGALKPQPGGAE